MSDESQQQVKPMNILLGDSSSFVKVLIESPGWKRVMFRRQGAPWTLDKTNHGLYWDLGEDITDLKHQFIIFKDPTIYLFFNYRGNLPAIEILDRYYDLIKRDLRLYQIKCLICGMNYKDIKVHKKIKKEILEWCLARADELGEDNCNYIDLEEIRPEMV